MPLLHVYDLGCIDGFSPRGSLRDGLILGEEGRWVCLGSEGVRWEWRVTVEPCWALGGDTLYASFADLLVCLDPATGALRAQVRLPGRVIAMAADAEGADVLLEGLVLRLDRHGACGSATPVPFGASAIARDHSLWLAGAAGVYRMGVHATRVSDQPCVALVARGDIQALVDGPAGAYLVELDDAPLTWSFFSATTEVLLPFGERDWLVCRREGGDRVRVVNRLQQALWSWEGPPVRDAGVADGCVVLDLGGEVALVRPGTPALSIGGSVRWMLASDHLVLLGEAGGARLLWVG